MWLVGLAGALKLADLPTFWESLEGWSLLPGWARVAAIGLVPVAEVALLLAWLFNVGRRGVLWSSLGLLLAFSAVYAWHAVVARPPSCGCFGVLARALEARETAVMVLVRNGVLAACLVSGLWGYGRGVRAAS